MRVTPGVLRKAADNRGIGDMLSGRLGFAGFAASALALAVLAAPAQAQFGGLLGGARTSSRTSDGCAEGRSRSTGSRVAGGILGGLAGGIAGRAGGVFSFVPIAGLTDQLTAAIACKLDPEEQKQAAEATLEATRSDDSGEVEVGAMSAWTSETRDDVAGTSTVVARNDEAGNGFQCITVTDVIIVKGEETRADKRMCRQPPAVRYTLNA
jgi:predicted lipid-binding transport protein (Tim44 family)